MPAKNIGVLQPLSIEFKVEITVPILVNPDKMPEAHAALKQSMYAEMQKVVADIAKRLDKYGPKVKQR